MGDQTVTLVGNRIGELHAARLQFLLVLLQLQQVLAAGESGEVPMEHHQQPSPAIVLQPMQPAAGVAQLERHGVRSFSIQRRRSHK